MSSFTTPLIVSPLPDGRNWKLVEPFEYHIGTKESADVISVPAGFVTDFASIPRIFFFLPDWATYSKSAVLHDWEYHAKEMSRAYADFIFLEAMLVDWRNYKSRYFMAYIEYWAVRLFGGLAWNHKNEPQRAE